MRGRRRPTRITYVKRELGPQRTWWSRTFKWFPTPPTIRKEPLQEKWENKKKNTEKYERNFQKTLLSGVATAAVGRQWQAYATRLSSVYLWALNSYSRYSFFFFQPHKRGGTDLYNGLFYLRYAIRGKQTGNTASPWLRPLLFFLFSWPSPDVLYIYEGIKKLFPVFPKDSKRKDSSPHIIWLYSDVKRVLYKTKDLIWCPYTHTPKTLWHIFFF